MDDLDAVADRLYALPPEEFTAARDAAAKQSADRQLRAAVKALRRPSPSAWVLNLLARRHADLLQQLLDLGPALAEAQRAGEGDALRTLGQQRRELVQAVTGTAVGLGDRAVTAQVRTDVEQTLEAALADPRAADAVRSGRLVRPLSYAGFGDVDVDGAVAVQRPARSPARPQSDEADEPQEPPAADLAALEQTALDASAALDDAVRACEQTERRRGQVEQRRADAQDAAHEAAAHVQRLEEQLSTAREREQRAREDEQAVEQDAAAADSDADLRQAAVVEAQAAAEQARTALDRARRGQPG